uniref:Putative terminase n=1 Tax=viral metagenome TaxID=1070528 RepID=A0A6M3J4U3_9ZZZZ
MSGNQYQPDPRQALFLSYYLDPKSKTFSNAYQSAILAEYSEEYAETITSQMPDWLSESLGDNKMLHKAEKNLDEFLDDNEDKKIKADITKFVASRLGKKKWSERGEITGADGKDLEFPIYGGRSAEV